MGALQDFLLLRTVLCAPVVRGAGAGMRARVRTRPCSRFRESRARARPSLNVHLRARRRWRQTPSCDGMSPQNNRHVGDGAYCQPEDYLTAAERAATLGI